MLAHNKTQTSIEAAIAKEPTAATDRERVLGVIRRAGDRGLTREEIAQKSGLSENSVRPRCCELLKSGHIKKSDRFAYTKSGQKASVLVVA